MEQTAITYPHTTLSELTGAQIKAILDAHLGYENRRAAHGGGETVQKLLGVKDNPGIS